MSAGMEARIAFVKARLDEDEAAAAEAARDGHAEWQSWWQNPGIYTNTTDIKDGELATVARVGLPVAAHIARHDPARVLREVATWRRILLEYSIPPGTDAVYGGTERETGFRLALSFAIKAKALEWKNHPDYREWEP